MDSYRRVSTRSDLLRLRSTLKVNRWKDSTRFRTLEEEKKVFLLCQDLFIFIPQTGEGISLGKSCSCGMRDIGIYDLLYKIKEGRGDVRKGKKMHESDRQTD